MLIRGPSLATIMSRYLIDRIESTPNIELLPHTELITLQGNADEGLTGVAWRDNRSGAVQQQALRHVFLFIGADPETAWLRDCGVEVDPHGFVKTGAAANPAFVAYTDLPATLQTTAWGAFAAGDVRPGAGNRVGAPIAERRP